MRRVARVLVRQGDCILAVLHQGDPHRIALPGGGVDPGETPEEAAVRELYEETSMRATLLEPLCVVQKKKRRTYIWRCEAVGVATGSEEGPALWAPPADFLAGKYGAEYAQVFELAGI